MRDRGRGIGSFYSNLYALLKENCIRSVKKKVFFFFSLHFFFKTITMEEGELKQKVKEGAL
jgi:hypothetical protein